MLRIRPANHRDLPLLQTWALQSAWESGSAEERAKTRPEGLYQYTQGMFQGLLATPEALALVAEVGGQPVGYVLGGPAPDSSTGEIQGNLLDLFVVPQLRQRGVGRALQQAALGQFTQMGLRKVKMFAGLHNQAALHMASTAGFKPEGLIGVREW